VRARSPESTASIQRSWARSPCSWLKSIHFGRDGSSQPTAETALPDIARVLGDDQRRHAAKLVEREQARMEEYATPPGRRPGG
jgi:hypothetical protein